MKFVRGCMYNSHLNKFEQTDVICLNDGQIECPRCKGNGYHYWYDVEDNAITKEDQDGIVDVCWVCKGNGFTDWVRLPFIGGWKEIDERLQEDIVREYEVEEYWDEITDQENSSFIIEWDKDE